MLCYFPLSMYVPLRVLHSKYANLAADAYMRMKKGLRLTHTHTQGVGEIDLKHILSIRKHTRRMYLVIIPKQADNSCALVCSPMGVYVRLFSECKHMHTNNCATLNLQMAACDIRKVT